MRSTQHQVEGPPATGGAASPSCRSRKEDEAVEWQSGTGKRRWDAAACRPPRVTQPLSHSCGGRDKAFVAYRLHLAHCTSGVSEEVSPEVAGLGMGAFLSERHARQSHKRGLRSSQYLAQ
jgi:hypothetical protein